MKKGLKRFWILAAICGGTTALFLLSYWALSHEPRGWGKRIFAGFGMFANLLQQAEFRTQDMRTRQSVKVPVDTNLVLVGIDRQYDKSYFSAEEIQENPNVLLLEQLAPLSRLVWVDVIERLAGAGAKAIVLDLVFAAHSTADDALAKVLDKYKDKVVIGWTIQEGENSFSFTKQLPDASLLGLPDASPVELDDRVGFVNIYPDPDQVVRRARFRLDSQTAMDLLAPGAVAESLAARTLRKIGRADLIPPGFDNLRFRWTGQPGFGYPVHPIGTVMSPRLWRENYQNRGFFRGKIVLIGATSELAHDVHRTPFLSQADSSSGREVDHPGDMLGPEIQLNILGAALRGGFLRDFPPWADMLIIGLAGLAALGLCVSVLQPLTRLLTFSLVVAGYWWLGQLLFDRASLVVPVAAPLSVLVMSGVLALGYDYLAEQFERARVRKTLERYVSKNVVREVLDNPATYLNSLGGKRQRVTVLFSDIRNFTTMTEGADPVKLVAQLNEYFQEMVGIVFAEKGTLDKFIGDAVMAVWGNIVAPGAENDANRVKKEAQSAVATALEMKRGLARLNVSWELRGIPQLAFGIGINHGEAIVGNLGSTEKMDPTVIGDAVNLGSRLESLTKKYHLDLLLGENVAPLVRERFILRTVALVAPKGKTEGAEVFTVIGERSDALEPAKAAWLDDYAEAVQYYRHRSFIEATALFEKCLQMEPGDYLCSMYLKKCAALIKDPPDAAWNGVEVMTEK